MSPPAAQSPGILAILRGLILLGVTEALFYRMLPDPRHPPFAGDLLGHLHESLNRAGSVAFMMAFLLATLTLAAFGWRAMRHRLWPQGLNGFVSVSLLCMSAMGLSAVLWERGPGFAIVFTLLALMTILFIAMNGFIADRTPWERALMVIYSSAAACSAVSVALRFAGRFAMTSGPGEIPRFLSLRRLLDASGYALSAGSVLLAGACLAAFMAFGEPGEKGSAARWRFVLSGAGAGIAAALFAAACLLGSRTFSPLGQDAGTLEVLIFTWCLFVATLTALSTSMDPGRRGLGYGLLLMVIAGYPLRIAYQDMLMVLGAVLVFGPRAVPRHAPARIEFVTTPRTPVPAPAPGGPPAGEPDDPLPLA